MPPPKDPPAAILGVTPKGKNKEKELEFRATSFETTFQKSGKKKDKVPTPELEELEEEEESTAKNSAGSEEEEEPSTPLPDQKPRRNVNTRSLGKKQPAQVYRSPYAPKCQSKILEKDEGSNKKSRGK